MMSPEADAATLAAGAGIDDTPTSTSSGSRTFERLPPGSSSAAAADDEPGSPAVHAAACCARPFERMETEAPSPHRADGGEEGGEVRGWARIRRVRELYVGPMSWLWALCVLGPLVLLCPCGALRHALRTVC
jgi:hypothetical protein